jgi:LPXTG-motif cell wall-anchored protein
VKSNVVSAQPTQPQQPQPPQAPQAQPAQEKVADGSFQETLKNNMPLVIVGSLLLVGGLIFFGNRRMS